MRKYWIRQQETVISHIFAYYQIYFIKQKRLSTLEWVVKINELPSEDRMNCNWNYVLLGENTFYGMSEKGAATQEILEYAKLSKAKVEGKLEAYF